jgi:nitrogen fixation/metabolism regulation signal transduction histidine kinase
MTTFRRSFYISLVLRVALLGALLFAASLAWVVWSQPILSLALIGGAVYTCFRLLRLVDETNRRLARFLESIRYSDFAIRFASGQGRGDSFEDVNRQFNEVLEAFRQTRAEKEAGLLFLNTIVQHLGTGVMAFDAQSDLLLSNNAAFQALGVYRLHRLGDLPPHHAALIQFVETLKGKGTMLYQSEAGRQLSVQGVALNLQGRGVRLVTIQNIHPELQRKELDAWRNLTRVLRHEIMNSVTPIISLIETMRDIVRLDLKANPPNRSSIPDLEEALEVVAARSKSLMDFVQAYRSFSAIPQPKVGPVSVRRLVDHVVSLSAADLKQAGIRIESSVQPEDLQLQADSGLIEMVLLNLVKNAREAMAFPQDRPVIVIRAGADARGRACIEVEDNGPGIDPILMEEIFIPFFTTKPEGTGIGLSISRQIMQMHGGDIRVSALKGTGVKFVLAF